MSALDTKFEDMPAGIIKNWTAWAQSHDWGESAYYQQGRLCGIIEHLHDGKNWTQGLVSFSTPRELRDWAGY